MNIDELKIKALLEGLEAQNIEEFMRQAKVGDYRNYGKAYFSAVRNKIEEKESKPLFTTDDGVKMLDRDSIVWMVRNKTLEKIKIHSIHLNECDFEHKVFAHESNADEYILKNKPLFSYEDFMRWGNVPYERVIMKLAKERASKK